MLKIAVINPKQADGLARTVIDGLCKMSIDKEIEFCLSSEFQYNLPLENRVLSEQKFIENARNADLILLFYAGLDVNEELANKIGAWKKTFVIDGSELGRNRRLDPKIM